MAEPNDRHRIYMYFQDCSGWQCQFLEADLKTSLRLQMHFTSSDKLVEFVECGGGFIDHPEVRMMLDQGTGKGSGGVFLSLKGVVILGERLTDYQDLISGIPVHSDRPDSKETLTGHGNRA
jgi:hypothetical protein